MRSSSAFALEVEVSSALCRHESLRDAKHRRAWTYQKEAGDSWICFDLVRCTSMVRFN